MEKEVVNQLSVLFSYEWTNRGYEKHPLSKFVELLNPKQFHKGVSFQIPSGNSVWFFALVSAVEKLKSMNKNVFIVNVCEDRLCVHFVD